MKKPALLFLFVLMATTAICQKKDPSKKTASIKEEKKSLPKRVYKSWMKIKASDENSSLTTKVFTSFLKSFRANSDREE